MVFLVDAGMLQDWLTDKRGDSFRVEDTRAFNLRNPGKSRHTSLDLRIEVMDHRVDTDGRAAVARALVHGHPTLSSTTPVAVRLAAPLRDDFRNFELCQQNLRLAALSREEATHYPALLRVHESFELRLPTTRLAGVTAGRGEYVPVWGEIMEWGTPLQQVLRDGCLSEQEAVALLLPVLRTVGRLAEKQHIVHRDIDEGNVFLVDGQPKLGDFGAATTFAEDASYTKTRLLGKTGQCPPEYLYSPDDQEGPEGITSQMTDAWLLGRLLLRMTTGAGNPYHPDTPLGEKYHPSLERLSSPLQDVVRGLCAPQWDERLDCAAAAQMLTAQLPALATGVPSPAPLESGSAQTPAVASRPLTAHEFFRHWMFDGQGSPQSVHRCLYSRSPIIVGHPINFVLTAAGHLYTWGFYFLEQRRQGAEGYRSNPTRGPLDNVTAITTGWAHSMALTRDGHLYTWGRNPDGQLGDGTTKFRPTPTRVPLDNVTTIAAGWRHSMALTRDGHLYTWGHNGFGQLGDGTKEDRPTPTRVPLDNITAIATCTEHSMALTSDGYLYTWGDNFSGQLGDGTKEDRPTPTRVPL
ncbi:protein kinase domain-containing protein, partial [Buchananella hordeovulneris]|uniref:RCC1 domain-containing protein n=1 Tax=Buchananella hordeovulneris TaxID=52770 RepID=UPI0026DD80A2